MGIREFGREVGVSGEAIRKAIAAGRIPSQFVGRRTRGTQQVPMISNVAGAKAAFLANTNPLYRQDGAKISEGKKRRPAPKTLEKRARAGQPQVQAAEPAPQGSGAARPSVPSITQSREITEAYRARLVKLEYEERAGKLVNADEVKVKLATMITAARSRLLGVPSKAKGRIPHLTVDEITTLTEIIREALEDVAVGR
jgi:phage terminase Nu1 subunit (DNA packaging protein)